jgi:hypothetical protein
MNLRIVATAIAALIVGLALGRSTLASSPSPIRNAPEAGRYSLHTGEYKYMSDSGQWTSSVGTFRIDTATGKASLYQATATNGGYIPGTWGEIGK